jgi:peptidyl-prolyl cis-trans isomerase D
VLQAFRSKGAGIVAKILFAALILSFALWGIGDYAFMRRSEPIPLRVAGEKISAAQLSSEYRREIDRLRRAFGQFDPETARQFGLMDRVIDRVILQALVDSAAQRLGVVIGDDTVRAKIVSNPGFAGPTGAFDRFIFQRALSENGMTERQYVELLRRDLTRDAVIGSIEGGARPPAALVDQLYRYRAERRIGETVFVAASSISDVGEPKDEDLKTLYEENTERFSEPEYRGLTLIRIGADDLVATIEPTEQQVREEFDAHAAEFRVPEKRELSQILFNDEAAANAAEERLAKGEAFDEVAKAAGQTPEQTSLGVVQQRELFPELADPAFALADGAISKPIKSPLGWHIMRVTKIEPAKEANFEEQRARLKTEVARRIANDSAYDAAVKVEDAVADGASLDDAAAKVGLKPIKVDGIDARGTAPNGTPVAAVAGAPEAMRSAFETLPGQTSPLIETKSGVWFVIRVDGVTPPRVKPLADVHDQVAALWRTQKQMDAAQARAEKILERIKSGQATAAAIAEFNSLKVDTTQPMLRTGEVDRQNFAPPEVAGRLFGLKVGEAAAAPSKDGYFVLKLTEIKPADPAASADGVKQLTDQLRQQMAQDLVHELGLSLRARYGVQIDQAEVEKLL